MCGSLRHFVQVMRATAAAACVVSSACDEQCLVPPNIGNGLDVDVQTGQALEWEGANISLKVLEEDKVFWSLEFDCEGIEEFMCVFDFGENESAWVDTARPRISVHDWPALVASGKHKNDYSVEVKVSLPDGAVFSGVTSLDYSSFNGGDGCGRRTSLQGQANLNPRAQ